jgi:hypothetical protein
MAKFKQFAFLTLILSAFVFTGCGDDDNDNDDKSSTTTEVEKPAVETKKILSISSDIKVENNDNTQLEDITIKITVIDENNDSLYENSTNLNANAENELEDFLEVEQNSTITVIIEALRGGVVIQTENKEVSIRTGDKDIEIELTVPAIYNADEVVTFAPVGEIDPDRVGLEDVPATITIGSLTVKRTTKSGLYDPIPVEFNVTIQQQVDGGNWDPFNDYQAKGFSSIEDLKNDFKEIIFKYGYTYSLKVEGYDELGKLVSQTPEYHITIGSPDEYEIELYTVYNKELSIIVEGLNEFITYKARYTTTDENGTTTTKDRDAVDIYAKLKFPYIPEEGSDFSIAVNMYRWTSLNGLTTEPVIESRVIDLWDHINEINSNDNTLELMLRETVFVHQLFDDEDNINVSNGETIFNMNIFPQGETPFIATSKQIELSKSDGELLVEELDLVKSTYQVDQNSDFFNICNIRFVLNLNDFENVSIENVNWESESNNSLEIETSEDQLTQVVVIKRVDESQFSDLLSTTITTKINGQDFQHLYKYQIESSDYNISSCFD